MTPVSNSARSGGDAGDAHAARGRRRPAAWPPTPAASRGRCRFGVRASDPAIPHRRGRLRKRALRRQCAGSSGWCANREAAAAVAADPSGGRGHRSQVLRPAASAVGRARRARSDAQHRLARHRILHAEAGSLLLSGGLGRAGRRVHSGGAEGAVRARRAGRAAAERPRGVASLGRQGDRRRLRALSAAAQLLHNARGRRGARRHAGGP
jgi:hypothetical protein